MDWITPEIAVGNLEDALALREPQETEIDSVLCLSGFPTLSYSPHLTWTGVTLVDGHGNDPRLFIDALQALSSALASGRRVLVHCMEGRSRSVLIVSLYLAIRQGISLDDAIEAVSSRRSLAAVDPGLLNSLPADWRTFPAGVLAVELSA